jgi:hypothetical protein
MSNYGLLKNRYHRLRRMHLGGLRFVREQFFLAATVPNNKRLVRLLSRPLTPAPGSPVRPSEKQNSQQLNFGKNVTPSTWFFNTHDSFRQPGCAYNAPEE